MKKRLYDFRAWQGVDISNETSLGEYGFLYNPKAKKNQHNIVYKLHYNRYAYSSVPDTIADCIAEYDWADWKEIESFTGIDWTSPESQEYPIVHFISDLLGYYGIENVFGSCYHEGFEITGIEE